jgi:hypothetical protein
MASKKNETPIEVPTKPIVGENEYSMVFTADEMLSVINILSFSKEIFNQMAATLEKEGDLKSGEIYTARAIMSQLIYAKFRDTAAIGEPTAREIH